MALAAQFEAALFLKTIKTLDSAVFPRTSRVLTTDSRIIIVIIIVIIITIWHKNHILRRNEKRRRQYFRFEYSGLCEVSNLYVFHFRFITWMNCNQFLAKTFHTLGAWYIITRINQCLVTSQQCSVGFQAEIHIFQSPNGNWHKFNRWTPACQSFDGNHSGEAIQEVIDCIVNKKLKMAADLPKFAVSDNATNMKKGISSSLFDLYLCCCHTQQLAVLDTFKEFHGVLGTNELYLQRESQRDRRLRQQITIFWSFG